MATVQVKYFLANMPLDDLGVLGALNRGADVEQRCPRLFEWLAAQVDTEQERRISDGNTEVEPGYPEIDFRLWSEEEIRAGWFAASLLCLASGLNHHLNRFNFELFETFSVVRGLTSAAEHDSRVANL